VRFEIPPASLLYPRSRALVNGLTRLDREGRWKLAGAAALIAGVWVGLFVGIRELLGACYGIELFGEYLVDRLLSLFFLSFSGILLFSNVVTGLASFYLSDDLPIVNAAPVERLRIFYARFTETVLGSSWMVAVFGAPVLLAYGTVHHASWRYYMLAAVATPAYFVIPATFAVAFVTILVNVFPARRARDFLMILGIAFLGVGFLLFRAIRPERLVDPNAFASMAEFFGQLSVPDSPFLPSTWITRALTAEMRGRAGAFEPASRLLLTAGAAVVMCAWFTSALYFSGWSKAQEGRRAYLNRFRGDALAKAGARVLGQRGGAILAKDARTFFRDAGQWSQLLLLLSVVGIYLLSIKALPFDALNFPTSAYRNAVAFLNLGMGGFVIAAIAARFLFPAISAEGRGIWILRAAPMDARELVRAKFGSGVVPLTVVGVGISISSNVLLRTSTFVLVESALTTAVIASAIAALAVGMGARMPDFKSENLQKVAASFGGLVYMAAALAYLAAVVALEAYPTWRIYESFSMKDRLTPVQLLVCGGCFAGVLLLSFVVGLGAMRDGARSLEEREYA
jgi:ABC-2 type transport system permease protein